MARLDLTPAQERWTIAGLVAVVLLIGAVYFYGPVDESPHARPVSSALSRPMKPGGYVLTKVSWGAVDRATPRGNRPPKARSDAAGPVRADDRPGEEMPAVFKELQGIPISVGGK